MYSPFPNPTAKNNTDPSQRFPHEVTIEACPSQLLKSIETLKKMGVMSTYIELSCNTISQIELFTRVLNRQEDEQRVANELKTTFFHNIRGKVKRTEMTRNQEFVTMKKMKFNSAYHVTLFMKYYEDRIKQLENQYRYTLVSGIEGNLHVYLNDDDSISSMFINQIRDMKKRLQFLEIKDMELCEKFIYSQKLGKQLNKMGIFNQIWYRGKESTIIFYSEKQTLFKIKQLVNSITKYHLTILKLQDESIPFLINYLLFGLLKKSILPEIRRLRAIQFSEVEFTQNKIGVVLHDKHEIFSSEIIEELMDRMKNYLLFTVRAKDARKFLNLLKKQCHSNESINFCYSKKTVCVCINVEKIKSYGELKKVLGQIPHCVNQDSQITFNWFHLQDESLKNYCKSLTERILMIFSSSQFHVQNFEKIAQYKSLKCVIKLKNISSDKKVLSQRVGDTLVNIIKAWRLKQSNKEKTNFEDNPLNQQVKKQDIQEDQKNQIEQQQSSQNDSEDQSECEDIELDEQGEVKTDDQQEEPVKNQTNDIVLKKRGIQIQNLFTNELRNFLKQKESNFYKPQTDNQDEWREEKYWRKGQELLINELKIIARIKHISFNEVNSQSVKQTRLNLNNEDKNAVLIFHEFISYSMAMFESPYYQTIKDKSIQRFEDLKVGQKWMICCEKEIEGKIWSYPLCSVEVMKKL